MEYHLHYIWLNRLFDSLEGVGSIENAEIEVIDVGVINNDSGADFFNAKIKINGILWVGNVEIHTNSKEWYMHRHDKDKSHLNTILHIVEKFEGEETRCMDANIPTAIIKYNREKNIQLECFSSIRDHIYCKELLPTLPREDITYWKDIAFGKKIKDKTNQIDKLLSTLSYDWDEAFYRLLMRYFGFNLNNDSMLEIAESLPYKILLKHRDNITQIEALLFGQANLLWDNTNIKNEYLTTLQKEYYFLSRMYDLKPINKYPLKFLRTRPQGFPTRRLAQIASIIHKTDTISTEIINIFDLKRMKKLFISDVSDFWKNNYSFKSIAKSTIRSGSLASVSIDSLIINVVIPYKYVYHIANNEESDAVRTLRLLDLLPYEDNKITRLFDIKSGNKTAKDSQSLIYIYKNYCIRKKCILCHWGRALTSNKLH